MNQQFNQIRWRPRVRAHLENRKTQPRSSDDVDARLVRAFMSLAPATRKNYQAQLRQLDKWLAGRELSDSTLADYLMHRHEKGLSPGSLVNTLNALKFRCKKLGLPSPVGPETEDMLTYTRREGSSRGRGYAPGLTLEEVESIIETTESNGSLWGLRDAAMIATAFYGGLRIGEVSQINLDDLTFYNDGTAVLLIRKSKTDQQGRGKTVPLSSDAVKRLTAWLEASHVASGRLFRSLQWSGIYKTGTVTSDGLTADHAGTIVKQCGKAAGLRITSHSLRRSFAQHLTRAGLSIQEVARAGRWASTDMVVRYVENETANQSAVLSVFEKHTPRLRVVKSG